MPQLRSGRARMNGSNTCLDTAVVSGHAVIEPEAIAEPLVEAARGLVSQR